MVEATAVHTMSSPAWRAATVVVEMYSLMGMLAGQLQTLGLSVVKTFLQVIVPFWRG